MNRSSIPLVLVCIAALVGGVWLSGALNTPEAPPATEFVSLVSTPRALPTLTLTDKNGATVGREVFEGQWSVVFMGFTSCGHICPTKMAELRMIHDAAGRRFTPVFFSVDPGRDTPEVIKAYVDGFEPAFRGLTGSPDAVAAFAAGIGAPYYVDTTPGNYEVDHSTALFLINPDGALAGTMTPPFDVAAIVRDLDLIL